MAGKQDAKNELRSFPIHYYHLGVLCVLGVLGGSNLFPRRNMTFKVKGKVWKYPGFGGWHFFTIGKGISAEIRRTMKLRTRGFGSIRVKAQIDKVEWHTSIFPTKEKTYLLPVKSNVRKKAVIEEGDTVVVELTLHSG